MLVRAATAADAHAVTETHVTGWQSGYRGLLPDAYLDALSVEDRTPGWARAIADGAQVLVADDGERVHGFVTFGTTRDADLPACTGEVQALYVRPGTWGRGVGGSLLDCALTRLAEAGCEHHALWTLKTNLRARRFYERRGWRADGREKTERRPGLVLHEVRYRLP
ncbi:GNAT family N-acetyltransferase [Kineococcus rhizosphaerae]|nr:GNAT family N-acetyltransferase [Kineococcus rhizosphaerae]